MGSNRIMPIVNLVSRAPDAFTVSDEEQLHELLEELGVVGEDEFTFTFRVEVPEEKRAGIRAALQARGEDGAKLAAILEAGGWDVSFLYDNW